MESILLTIKKLLGIPEEYTQYDADIILHINSAFMILRQLGVGPTEGFMILDEYAVWTDFIPDSDPRFESVKTYIGAKVRLMFDPPTGSVHMDCINKLINELEWRLNLEAETTPTNEEVT